MTDHEIDGLVATCNPVDERALQALPLSAEELRLCEVLMQETAGATAPAGPSPAAPAPAPTAAVPAPAPAAAPARRPPRRARRVLVAVAAVLVAVVATVAIAGREPGSSGTAWAAPLVRLAESSPLLLLDAPGWKVTRADETDDREGEMTFTAPDGAGSADLHWRGGSIVMWQRDRAHDALLVVQRTVLGKRAQVSQYRGSTDFTAIWPDRGRVLEFRAVTADLAAFERLLGSLRRVDVDTWLTAMPASVVKSAGRAGVVRAMLADIPQPPRFDAARLEQGPGVSDRYQVGAQVTGAVSCAWIARWDAARKRGDDATARAAIEAMQTARDWKILREMEPQGAWSEVLWAYADAMRGDGTWHGRPLVGDVQSGLGCDRR